MPAVFSSGFLQFWTGRRNPVTSRIVGNGGSKLQPYLGKSHGPVGLDLVLPPPFEGARLATSAYCNSTFGYNLMDADLNDSVSLFMRTFCSFVCLSVCVVPAQMLMAIVPEVYSQKW